MRYAFASLALAAIASAAPQVTSAISPSGSSPAGCSSSYSGTFAIQVVNVTSSAKRDVVKRQSDAATTLILSLSNGKLTDSKGRTGYIAANDQFQFDGPPQTGAIYTSGWSVCSNGSLALGDDAIFYQCLSGNFYNLYDKSTGAQCSPVYIDVIAGSSSAVATVESDGQPTASAVASQISDGQVTASAVSSAVSQISDGQVQATSAAAVSQISDGQIQATTSAAAVSQISDGQVQATTAAAVSQISDGQIQATTAAAVSQISDGQIQATTAAAVSQISDGQIQATTAAAVSQISDGQIQATTAAIAPVSQISDGQIQATTGANSTYGSPSATVVPYTGAAMPTALRGELFGLAAAGVMAVAML